MGNIPTGGSGGGISSVSGTSGEIAVANPTTNPIVSLDSALVLPSGTVATTQSPLDDSTQIATTQYADSAVVAILQTPYLSFQSKSLSPAQIVGPVRTVTPPVLTGWTSDNSAVLDTSNGYLYITGAATSAVNIRVIYRTAPSTPYTFTFLVAPEISGGANSGGGTELGWVVGFRQSSTGKIQEQMIGWGFTATANIGISNFTTATSHSSDPAGNHNNGSVLAIATRQLVWVRISDNGTNLIWSTSIDGINWTQQFSLARGSFMTGGPDQICLGLYPNSGAAQIAVWSMSQS